MIVYASNINRGVDADGDSQEIRVSGPGDDALKIDNPRTLEVLEGMLTALKKIEYHLMLASDTELKDEDV